MSTTDDEIRQPSQGEVFHELPDRQVVPTPSDFGVPLTQVSFASDSQPTVDPYEHLQQELRSMGYDEPPALLPENLKHRYPIPSNTQGAEAYARTLDRLQSARDEVFEFVLRELDRRPRPENLRYTLTPQREWCFIDRNGVRLTPEGDIEVRGIPGLFKVACVASETVTNFLRVIKPINKRELQERVHTLLLDYERYLTRRARNALQRLQPLGALAHRVDVAVVARALLDHADLLQHLADRANPAGRVPELDGVAQRQLVADPLAHELAPDRPLEDALVELQHALERVAVRPGGDDLAHRHALVL